MKAPLLSIRNLSVNFKTHSGSVQAIRDLSLDLKHQETLAIVGESGSGKTVTARAIMQLLSDNAVIADGSISYKDRNLLHLTDRQMQEVRGVEIAMIFQDPMTSLNPSMTIGDQIMEPLIKKRGYSRSDARQKALQLLEQVGMANYEKRLKSYPFEFSGGQRQRIVIAIALAGDPQVLIADEPTTALDVTIQAQILELLKELQEARGMSIIMITHDLGVVANMADRVAVMYAGKIVEIGGVDDIYYNPQHPYTWGLLSAMPTLDISRESSRLYAIPGTPPNLLHPPQGDAFAPRNEYALAIDYEEAPPFFQVSDQHFAATWLLDPRAPEVTPPTNIQERHRYFNTHKKGGNRS